MLQKHLITINKRQILQTGNPPPNPNYEIHILSPLNVNAFILFQTH